MWGVLHKIKHLCFSHFIKLISLFCFFELKQISTNSDTHSSPNWWRSVCSYWTLPVGSRSSYYLLRTRTLNVSLFYSFSNVWVWWSSLSFYLEFLEQRMVKPLTFPGVSETRPDELQPELRPAVCFLKCWCERVRRPQIRGQQTLLVRKKNKKTGKN